MPVSRSASLHIRNFLDNWLPAKVRDSHLVMAPLLGVALGRHRREFMAFKESAFALTPDQFADVYRRVAGTEIQGETDLNEACTAAILGEVKECRVLEVGCGRGWLAGRMVGVAREVTASDMVLSDSTRAIASVKFEEASVEALPYPDDSFDVVVCTHTLEHVQDLPTALAELRRVAQTTVWSSSCPRSALTATASTCICTSSPTRGRGRRWRAPFLGATLRDLGDWFYVEPVGAAAGPA